MEFADWMKNIITERLGENIDISSELSDASSTEILIGKLEVTMSKEEFRELISKASECDNDDNCGSVDFSDKCAQCRINEFTSKFSKFIE